MILRMTKPLMTILSLTSFRIATLSIGNDTLSIITPLCIMSLNTEAQDITHKKHNNTQNKYHQHNETENKTFGKKMFRIIAHRITAPTIMALWHSA